MGSELLKALKALPADPKRRVRAALAFRNVTQTKLAKATGIDPGMLSNALSGYRDLTDDQKDLVAGFLDVPPAVLFPEVTV